MRLKHNASVSLCSLLVSVLSCGAQTMSTAETSSTDPPLPAVAAAPSSQNDSALPTEDASADNTNGYNPPPDSRCSGDDLDFDNLSTVCRTDDSGTDGPVPEGLILVVEPDPITAVANSDVAMQLRMTNTTDRTMPVSLTTSCFTFQVSAWQNGERKDFASECGGMCGTSHHRFELLPGGSLSKNLQFHSSKRAVVFKNNRCENLPRQPLPTGDYTLQVQTPFAVSSTDGSSLFLTIPAKITAPARKPK